jgi:hypothetical protein
MPQDCHQDYWLLDNWWNPTLNMTLLSWLIHACRAYQHVWYMIGIDSWSRRDSPFAPVRALIRHQINQNALCADFSDSYMWLSSSFCVNVELRYNWQGELLPFSSVKLHNRRNIPTQRKTQFCTHTFSRGTCMGWLYNIRGFKVNSCWAKGKCQI